MRRASSLFLAGLALAIIGMLPRTQTQEAANPKEELERLKLADCKITVLGQTTANLLTIQRGEVPAKEGPATGWKFVVLTVRIEKPKPGALYINSRDFVLAYEREAAGQMYERHEGCLAIERLGPDEPKDFTPGTIQAREGFFDPIGFPDQNPKGSAMYLRLAFHVHADTAKAELCVIVPKVPVEFQG